MMYYVVKKGSDTIALLFHDPTSSYFSIETKSSSFRKCFYASVSSTKAFFRREESSIVAEALNLNTSYWPKKVLEKACGSFWEVSSPIEVSSDLQVADVVAQYL